GVSAIDTGHASEGVFALERVLLFFPNDHTARMELARGYYILEEYARARQEFEVVLKSRPAKKAREIVQLFLDKIRLKEARYKTTSSGYVELSMGSDSNINSGADKDEQTIITTLSADSLSQKDTFTDLAGSWQITHPVAPGWLTNATITGTLRKNTDLDQFDNLTATLQAGITRLHKQSRYKAEVISQQYNLDGDSYRTLNGLNLSWHLAPTQTSSLNTTLQYAVLDYPDIPVKNSSLNALSLTYSNSLATVLNPTFFASVNFGSEIASEDLLAALSTTERDLMGLRAGVILGLSPKTALQFSGAFQSSKYAGVHSLSSNNSIREDDHISSSLNLLWLFTRDWRLDARFSYSENRSNVEIFRYNRTQFSLNLNYAF
ncbi:MAG: surface lipoprotein assembly modifier, partial [Gammaproteobacteria bacterium]|nr:surface lipoprotein assembly modifier [Gammaproteobacteria bacterium]